MAYGPPGFPSRPPRKNRGLLWGVIALVIVILGASGGVAAYLLTRGDDGKKVTAATTTVTTKVAIAGTSSAPSTGTGATGTTNQKPTTSSISTTSSTTTITTEPQGAWTQLDPAGYKPEARSRYAMVYDRDDREMIIFGGRGDLNGASQEYNDTWAYDPATDGWTNLDPNGVSPNGRFFHSMVYLSGLGKVLLFGGGSEGDQKLLRDTWVYDPGTNAWTLLSPSGDVPSGRYGQAMAFDSTRGKVILFGGMRNSSLLDDTWAYDPQRNTWTQLDPGGDTPSPRYGHSMVFDPNRGMIYLFGGAYEEGDTLTTYNDLWVYDCARNTWARLDPFGDRPSTRAGQSMVLDLDADKLMLFAGYGGGALNDAWTYDMAQNIWTELDPPGNLPPARWFHSMAYNEVDHQVIVFGGRVVGEGPPLGDTWAFSL